MKNNKISRTATPNLGEDLEIEILLQLREKSLMRFKCVQRSWNKLIKSPYFLNRRSKLCIPRDRSLLIIKKNSEMSLLSCDNENNKPVPVKSLFSRYIERIEWYGSCNGVFCLKGSNPRTTRYDQLIMWNPTTNEVHRIPPRPSFQGMEFLYGFGAVKGDFNVVKLNIYNNGRTKVLYAKSDVYNLRTKSWKVIHNRYRGTMIKHKHPSRYNALVNGVYHWITNSQRYYAADILCFNFHSNKFQPLKAPYICGASYSYCDNIIEIKGSLGYVLQNNYSHMACLDIWVMDQKNKWSKNYNLNIRMFSLRGFGNDGAEIFGGKAGELLKSYDDQGNKLRQFQIKIPEKDDYFRIYEYVPSLALLSK